MRLFHVSEEENISEFVPRLPTRKDLDPNAGLVWAIDEARLSNFLTPRDCPRVGWHINQRTKDADRLRFFTDPKAVHGLVIEDGWFAVMGRTTLYLYEFDPAGFALQDEVAGYYVAKTTQIPKAKHTIPDLFAELFRRGVELRVVGNLWNLADAVKGSTLDWSLCRMAHARPRPTDEKEEPWN